MDFIKVKPSPTFLSVLEELHTSPGAPKSIKNFFAHKKKCSSTKKINNKSQESDDEELPPSELLLLTSDVKWCHDKIRERGIPHRIHKLLNESTVVLPAYKEPPRDPELEARVQRLRDEQANREYATMTENLKRRCTGANVSSIGQELREMHREVNRQIITGVQYLVSIIGTFFALYVGLGFAMPDYGPRILVGIIGALIVGLAEIYFIIREDIRAESDMKKKK